MGSPPFSDAASIFPPRFTINGLARTVLKVPMRRMDASAGNSVGL